MHPNPFRIAALLGLLFLPSVLSHHLVAEIHIDSIPQGPGTCMRVPPNTNPMTNIYSADMACNVGGGNSVALTCPAKAGSSITVQWRTWPDGSQDTPIDAVHQGPCAVYMKRVSSPTSTVAGGGWFKIWHDGFRDGAFCTERLRNNGNRMTAKIPEDLASGYYIFRAEQLALHEAKVVGGAQWYVGCAQLYVESTGGSSAPDKTVSIPGYVSATEPGVLYDYWANMKPASYAIPGPAPYVSSGSGGGDPIPGDFVKYEKYGGECLVKNANWCAVSVPAFKDQGSCYSSAALCWSQLDKCYAVAPPTGNKGCREWEARCTRQRTVCEQCSSKSCTEYRRMRRRRGVAV